MKRTLSSEVLPSAPIDVLRQGARRRSLRGLEWCVQTGSQARVDRGSWDEVPVGGADSVPAVRGIERDNGEPPIEWFLLRRDVSLTELLYWSRQAHLIGAGFLLRTTAVEFPLCVPLALLHPTDRAAARRAAAWARMHDTETAWELHPEHTKTSTFEDVLDVTIPTLGHVRLIGAGPESRSGSGDKLDLQMVMEALTLRGFSGTVALTRSARGSTRVWREWLFQQRGWGCNTAAKKTEAS